MTNRVFVTGGAGFIGRAVVRHLRERGDDVTAIVRDPTRAAALDDLGVRVVPGDLGSAAVIRDAMSGCDGVDPPGRLVPGRDHAVRAPGDVRDQRGRRRPGARRRDRGRRAPDRLRLDGERPRRHQRPARERDARSRSGRRLPELLRRDEGPGPPDRGGTDRGWRADRDRDAGHHLRSRAITRPSVRSSKRRSTVGRLPSCSGTWGSRRSTSTIWPRASSRSSIVAGSASRTC